MKSLSAIFALILAFGSFAFAQNSNSIHRKGWSVSDAYVVLVKEKAQVKGDLYEAKQQFTSEAIQVKTAALRLSLLEREINNLSKENTQNSTKLSAAFGDLLLAKIQSEVELFELRQKFTPDYPDVKKKEIQLASLKSDIYRIRKNIR